MGAIFLSQKSDICFRTWSKHSVYSKQQSRMFWSLAKASRFLEVSNRVSFLPDWLHHKFPLGKKTGVLGRMEPKRLKRQDLSQATANWNKNHLLGTGSFGAVYKGEMKARLPAERAPKPWPGTFINLSQRPF